MRKGSFIEITKTFEFFWEISGKFTRRNNYGYCLPQGSFVVSHIIKNMTMYFWKIGY